MQELPPSTAVCPYYLQLLRRYPLAIVVLVVIVGMFVSGQSTSFNA